MIRVTQIPIRIVNEGFVGEGGWRHLARHCDGVVGVWHGRVHDSGPLGSLGRGDYFVAMLRKATDRLCRYQKTDEYSQSGKVIDGEYSTDRKLVLHKVGACRRRYLTVNVIVWRLDEYSLYIPRR